MSTLPVLFLDRLKRIVPQYKYHLCWESFASVSPLMIRINTLKISRRELLESLGRLNISYVPILPIPDALELKNISTRQLQETEIFKKGFVYCQSLSSMLPAMILDPKPGERVLDMCAAPGSKTTQMAALMHNQGIIVAVEVIRERFYKLKSVVQAQGAEIVSPRLMDARRFRPPRPPIRNFPRSRHLSHLQPSSRSLGEPELFDKVLVDAPCSSEARFKVDEPKTYRYWSPRKIKEMVRKQRGLLLNASRWLKPDGVLVYSTCSFAPEENEGVVNWLLKKTQGTLKVIPAPLKNVETYPAVLKWQENIFDRQLDNCVRVLPNERMEGFFIAKLKMNG